MESIPQSASGSLLSADKGLPDPRLRDKDPRVLCSPKTGFAPSPNMDSSSFAQHQAQRAGLNQKGAKIDKHITLFLSSKCSPGTALQKGDITLHQSFKAVGLYNITLKISSHMPQWPCRWVVTACGWCRKQDHTTMVC